MKSFFAALAALILVAGEARGQIPVSSPHGSAPAAQNCQDCHTSESWTSLRPDMSFNHGATGFPLDGRHAESECASCHLDLKFDNGVASGADCAGCHVDVHRGNLGPTCNDCHNTRTFDDVAGTEVHMRTTFPLEGAHLQTNCESCHSTDTGGSFSTISIACASCHRRDYQRAATIDHQAAGFSANCEQCHSQYAWGGTGFDHLASANGYPLVGAHARTRCASCHIVPGFELVTTPETSDDCIACHDTTFQTEHGGRGFPVTCLSCHNQDSWESASFEDHDRSFFPIFSGAHRGKWEGCDTCHNLPGDLGSFTCFSCHEHDQSRTNEKHREVGGYTYDSRACLDCHRNGKGDD